MPIENKINKFKVKINSEKCKGCGLCVYECPKDVLEISKKSNKKGYFYAKVNNQRKEYCTECGNCYVICGEPGTVCVGVYKNL